MADTKISGLPAVVSVLDHGAVGDRSSDDTAAINKAIAAVNALSGQRTIWLLFK